MSQDKKIAVAVEALSKSFILPHEQASGLKQLLVNKLKGKKGYDIQHVLNDVSFEIEKGDFFGIVGRNGSGKSTLLKLLAGIYAPDKGLVHVNGTLTPFIELGVGFNPELSGRDNVFLNGALLGFGKQEMEEMYDEIVEFAELEKFMDQKLKNYSSGMQVRLAFSIAIRANSDILILDEVLAVGDEAFQRKCESVFEKYKARKQTIILVTHDMAVVERFCTKALMLDSGNIVSIGSPRKIAQRYSDTNQKDYIAGTEKKYTADIDILTFDPSTLKPKKKFVFGEKMLVRLSWKRDGVYNAGVSLMKQTGEYIYGTNTLVDKFKMDLNKKEISYIIDINVGKGEYFLKAGLFGKTDSEVLEFIDEGPIVLVDTKSTEPWGGLFYAKHEWRQ